MSVDGGRILAHAFGARYDLPVPLYLFIIGGAVVVGVSFLFALREDVDPTGAPQVEPDRTLVRPLFPEWGILSCLVLAFLIWCGLTGSQQIPENILPTSFWLYAWIAVPLTCGIVGDWTQPVNPFAFLAKLADQSALRRLLLRRAAPLRWPRVVGWWVAVVLYFATACGELVYNLTATVPHFISGMLIGYAAASAVGGLLFGRAWIQQGEMFSVLYGTWGRLGYFRFGAVGRRRFAGGLDVPFEATASRIAFVLFLLISVNFDGLLATPRWRALELKLPSDVGTPGPDLDTFRTVVFILLALAIAVVFGGFAYAASRTGGHARDGFRGALAGLLPSVLPIAFGYLLAHNLQYILVNGQLILPLIGNPTGRESWPLTLPYPFNDDYEPKIHFLPPSFYWYFSIAIIIVVHVIAVFLAHRHLTRRADSVLRARRSEYPWLVAMVGYTMLSLWLIAQPIAKETGGSAAKTAATAEAVMPAGR